MITLPFKQNAEKVPETKKEARRRTSQYVEGLLLKVYGTLYFNNNQNVEKVSETKKEHRRRTTSTSRYSR